MGSIASKCRDSTWYHHVMAELVQEQNTSCLGFILGGEDMRVAHIAVVGGALIVVMMAQGKEKAAGVVECSGLVVRDERGLTRIRLGVSGPNGEPSVSLISSKGRTQARIAILEEVVSLEVLGADGVSGVRISAREGMTKIVVLDEKGVERIELLRDDALDVDAGLVMRQANDAVRAKIEVGRRHGGRLRVYDVINKKSVEVPAK